MGKKKQNGFGNPKSFDFKGVENRVYKGKGPGAAGQYPSNRRYGTTVQRTVIEQYDLDSDWTRWRRGFEYYNLGAYLQFDTLDTKLYQGTEDEVAVRFTGQRFATKNADSNTHYSIKREVLDPIDLGVVTQVFNNRQLYPDDYQRNEIVAAVANSGRAESTPNRLVRCVGERISDGFTEANIINVLTTDRRPAVYLGKGTVETPNRLTAVMPLSTFGDADLQSLIGQVLVLEDLIVERALTAGDTFIDDSYFFSLDVVNAKGGSNIKILDNDNTALPPDLLDLTTLTPLYESAGNYTLNASYLFDKQDYQRFFGQQYLTADVVASEVGTISYLVPPLRILGVQPNGENLDIVAEPFVGSCEVFASAAVGFVVFNDDSFTTTEVDTYDGEYYHKEGAPGDPLWQRLNTDVDPWMDEVFIDGGSLRFADIYVCSCPDYLHTLLRMPEATEGNNRNNRQRRAPLPSAQGQSTYGQLGLTQAAGAAASWETLQYKTSHRMCKHTVASHFTNKIKVKEPKGYPTLVARETFEEKLEADIKEVADEFLDQLKRSEITSIEIIAALAAGLNLNEVQLASVIINSFTTR